MPSLVLAVRWLIDHLWEQRGDIDTCLFVLNKWVRPRSLEGDKQPMHEAVMGMIRQPLLEVLNKYLVSNESKNEMLMELIHELEKQAPAQKNCLASGAEVRNWTSGNRESPLAAFKGNLSMLLFWNTAAGIHSPAGGPSTPQYSIRHTLTVVRYFGATRVLKTMVDEVVRAQQEGIGEQVLDVISSILCTAHLWEQLSRAEGALSVRAIQSRQNQTLRDALDVELQGARKLISSDRERAEALKRLHHRLEMNAVSMPAPSETPMAMADVMNLDLSQSIDLTQRPPHHVESQDVFGSSGTGLGLDIDTALAASTQHAKAQADGMGAQSATAPLSAEDDIFAGLGPLEDMDVMDFS